VCAACHATGEFTRPGFFATWRGGPIAGLFDLIRTTMPQDDPGALPPASYADVLAYLLRLNGFPAGTGDLPAEAGGLGAILVDPPDRGPQTSPSRSTRNGVYAAAQAALGQERYALQCQSCHTPASHTGPTFVNAWRGRPLWDLLEFIRWNMPQGEPGVLTAEECAQLVAYLLQMNGLPPGPAELPTDSITLSAIRFDPVSPPPGGTGTR
jgi:mono/diheme cytochrome c family protein